MADAEMFERITQLGVEATRLSSFAEGLPLDDVRVTPLANLAVSKRLEQMTLMLADIGLSIEHQRVELEHALQRIGLNTEQTEMNTRQK